MAEKLHQNGDFAYINDSIFDFEKAQKNFFKNFEEVYEEFFRKKIPGTWKSKTQKKAYLCIETSKMTKFQRSLTCALKISKGKSCKFRFILEI